MLTAPVHQLRSSPHVVVVGNEKGGSGKTTIAMHVAVALLKAGQRVATIDLDGRQRTLTHYVESRRGWARRSQADLELPTHFCIARVEGPMVEKNEAAEFSDFQRAVAAAQDRHDFVVIDTPPHDSYLMRLAHSIADTLVTPLNDSFLDLDVLARIDPVTFDVTGVSHYGELVRETRRHRRAVDGALIDWVVVRNRVSLLGSRIQPGVCAGLGELASRLGFRVAPRVNAAGRLDDPNIAYRLLMSETYEEAFALAGEINRLNEERQALTRVYQLQAHELVQEQFESGEYALVCGGEDWPAGIVGLVATC